MWSYKQHPYNPWYKCYIPSSLYAEPVLVHRFQIGLQQTQLFKLTIVIVFHVIMNLIRHRERNSRHSKVLIPVIIDRIRLFHLFISEFLLSCLYLLLHRLVLLLKAVLLALSFVSELIIFGKMICYVNLF